MVGTQAMQLPAVRCSPCGRRHLLANNNLYRPSVVSLCHQGGRLVVHASPLSPPPPTEEDTKDTKDTSKNASDSTFPRTSPMIDGGGNNNGNNNEPPEDRPRSRANDLLVATLTIAGGAVGSVALLLGIALNVDPFGNLHWDARDALIGLACVTPSLLVDAIIMVPDYSAPKYKKTIRLAKYSPAERRRMRAASQPLGLPPLRSDGGGTSGQDATDGAPSTASSQKASSSSAVVVEEMDLLSAIAAQAEAQRAEARSGSTASTRTSSTTTMLVDKESSVVEVATATNSNDEASETTAEAIPSTSTLADAPTALSAEEVPDEELYIEKEITLRKPQPPLASALHRVQQNNIFENPGRGLSPAGEAVAIVTSHFAEEMLKRAVLLTALTNWLMDRMYEADMVDLDNMVHLPNGITMLPHDMAAWGVVAGGSVAVVLLSLRKMLTRPDFGFVVAPGGQEGTGGAEVQPLSTSERARATLLERLRSMAKGSDREKEDGAASSSAASSSDASTSTSSSSSDADALKNMLVAAGDDADGNGTTTASSPTIKKKKFKQQLRSKAEKVLDDVRQRSVYATGIEGGRRLLEWVGLSTAFVLTGNLVAPLMGAIVTDAVFSLYQRAKLKKAMEAQAKQMTEMLTLFREINSRGSGNN